MNFAEPTVSVVVATRNRPVLLRACLEAVAAQNFVGWECLVIDDGSSAENIEACESLVDDLGYQFLLHRPPVPGLPGTGPAAARNRGLRLARGEFIAFCDDDDRWRLDDHLAVAVNALWRHDADFFFANQRGERGKEIVIPDWFPACPQLAAGRQLEFSPAVHEVPRAVLAEVMRRHRPHLNGCVVRRTLLEEVGGFWEKMSVSSDVDLVLRLVDRSQRLLYRPDHVAAFNCSPRTSVINGASAIDRCLQTVQYAQHVRVLCADAEIRRCARSLESWHLRELGDHLMREGRWSAAVSMAWQALCVYPSAGAAASLLQTLFRQPSGNVFPRRERSAREPAAMATAAHHESNIQEPVF
jgi:glycosyltransferase involved in cell wall biosynthesis